MRCVICASERKVVTKKMLALLGKLNCRWPVLFDLHFLVMFLISIGLFMFEGANMVDHIQREVKTSS